VSALLGAVMVGAGALCFCGAVLARRWIGIAAAGIMLLAMADLAFLGLVPGLAWAGSLLVVGLLLGFGLRRGLREVAAEAPDHGPMPADGRGSGAGAIASPPQSDRLARGIAVATAVAYPVMAGLILVHGGGTAGIETGEGTHAGHGSGLRLAATAAALLLAATFVTFALLVTRRRRGLLALEAAGMGAMLLAMLLPHD